MSSYDEFTSESYKTNSYCTIEFNPLILGEICCKILILLGGALL